MMKYNLYNVFYSILDLILLKLTTAEIKLMVLGEYGFDPFEFIFLYGMRKYSQMKTDSTFFFFLHLPHLYFFWTCLLRRGKQKQKYKKWDYIKLKTFAQQRKLLTKQKGCLLNGRKYVQVKYLVKD